MSLFMSASQTKPGSYSMVVVGMKAQQLRPQALWLLTLKAVMCTIDRAKHKAYVCIGISLMPKPLLGTACSCCATGPKCNQVIWPASRPCALA